MISAKKILSITACLLMLLLAACGSGSDNSAVSGRTGQYEVRGIYYNGQILDINDFDELEDLYDGTMLTINEDGSFVYLNSVFGKKGSVRYLNESDTETLLLDSTEAFMYGYENGELVQKPSEDADPQKYIAYVRDENTLEVVEYDAASGKPAADKDPFIFVLSGEESSYLDANKFVSGGGSGSSGTKETTDSSKTDTTKTDSTKTESSTPKGGSSYQAILDEYTAKMEKAVPGLVSEYKSEAAGVSDIERRAEICNNKVSKLAEICNDGVSEMAGLQQKNGDSYDTYESWANKLMDNYTEIANEIMNAYLEF